MLVRWRDKSSNLLDFSPFVLMSPKIVDATAMGKVQGLRKSVVPGPQLLEDG